MNLTPYSTVVPLVDGYPKWVPESDKERIASYATYESIYWNVPQALKLLTRGTDDKPVYIPNAMTIVDTTAHYMMKGLEISFVDQDPSSEAALALKAFLDREEFYSRFNIAKHSGVVRGDFVFHITADSDKPEGRRISINSVDPASYFPVSDDDDLDRVDKVRLVEQVLDADGEVRVRMLTYSYNYDSGTRKVVRQQGVYELDKWFEIDAEALEEVLPEEFLPDDITTIPVYHFRNREWQGQEFGSSELRGFEQLISSVSQVISDEQMALALDGVGVYFTNAPSPVDVTGASVSWSVGPGRIIEATGSKKELFFERVQGVSSVTPSLDHARYIEERLMQAAGIPGVAVGAVDVQVAESGIALAIRFSPMMAKVEQRDLSGVAKLRQMFFDWKWWHKAFESQDFTTLVIEPTLGDKLPFDKAGRFTQLMEMLKAKVISKAYFRKEARALGFIIPDDIDAEILAEIASEAEALDMAGNRLTEEAQGGGGV